MIRLPQNPIIESDFQWRDSASAFDSDLSRGGRAIVPFTRKRRTSRALRRVRRSPLRSLSVCQLVYRIFVAFPYRYPSWAVALIESYVVPRDIWHRAQPIRYYICMCHTSASGLSECRLASKMFSLCFSFERSSRKTEEDSFAWLLLYKPSCSVCRYDLEHAYRKTHGQPAPRKACDDDRHISFCSKLAWSLNKEKRKN